MPPLTLESISESIEIWEKWLAKPDEGMVTLARETLDELREKKDLLENLLAEFRAYGLGFTLRHKKEQRWGFILRDASQPGLFRWQEFGCSGFIGHMTYETAEECLGDMVDSGYVHPDEDALLRVFKTTEWRRGMEITNVIQAANARLITWEEANRRMAAINASYSKEAA